MNQEAQQEDRSHDLSWKTYLQQHLNNEDAGPAFCVQGGGARGGWEAGVIAAMLKDGPNTTPSSIWGTSAGALNALWTRDPLVQKKPEVLLEFWLSLARRILILGLPSIGCLIAIPCLILWRLPLEVSAWLFGIPVVAFLILYVLAHLKILTRLPGLLPAKFARLIVPRPSAVGPGPNIYICTSDINSASRPNLWDGSPRNWFLIEKESSKCIEMSSDDECDAFHAAVASASLPVMIRPVRIGNSFLLDGGLVANLPAGFITTNGALGGAYVLCIIPKDVATLRASDPIEYRTLKFLFDLKAEQAKHRKESAKRGMWAGPVHAHVPIFVLSPKIHLKSGLVFFFPCLLRREFSQAMVEAKDFCTGLEDFKDGKWNSLDEYLIENVLSSCTAPGVEPKPNFWYKWVNSSW